MAWIQAISEQEARGELKQEYEAALRRTGKVYNVLKVMSLNPAMLHASVEFYKTLMHHRSQLPRAVREMLAVVVSSANQCHY